jgi:hypothetical protein
VVLMVKNLKLYTGEWSGVFEGYREKIFLFAGSGSAPLK